MTNKYNGLPKLVRDLISETLRLKGISHTKRTANEEEYPFYLRKKLLEETYEFLEDPSKEELADVLEVTYEFRDYLEYKGKRVKTTAIKGFEREISKKVKKHIIEPIQIKEYTDELFLEQINKFLDEPNKRNLVGVLRMVYSACDYIGISKEELESVRQIKEKVKGKFLEKIILEEVNE